MASDIQDNEAFRDSVTHIDKEGHRVFFYPKKPAGKLYNLRTYVSWIFLAILFSLPFVKIHGNPVFLFNVLERKFILFGVRFWPQDFFLFVLGMLIFIVFIALFTVVYGRVFCGWVCPQTIFMEMVFRKIEYFFEGDAQYQRKLNNSPWNAEKIRRRGLKLLVFYLLSFLISNTFLAYIIGIDNVLKIATEPLSQHIGGFVAMLIFSGVFFFVFAWFREQACLVVCPYGRMQGVLLDKHSIVVAYDHKRGEPRSKFTKDTNTKHGDCIDCSECVRVCPTGIDIRHGTQLECTNCTACIDACDMIMEKVNKPKGLIRYASEFTIRTGKRLRWTPRMIAYTAILFVLIALESFLLTTRTDIDVTMVRTRGVLFNTELDGRISNLYNIKLINKTTDDMNISIVPEDPTIEIKLIGHEWKVKADSLLDGELFVIVPADHMANQKQKIEIQIWSNGHLITEEKTTFIGPAGKAHH